MKIDGIINPSLSLGLTKRYERERTQHTHSRLGKLDVSKLPKSLDKRHDALVRYYEKAVGDSYIYTSRYRKRMSHVVYTAPAFSAENILTIDAIQIDLSNPKKRQMLDDRGLPLGITRHAVQRYFERHPDFAFSDITKLLGYYLVGFWTHHGPAHARDALKDGNGSIALEEGLMYLRAADIEGLPGILVTTFIGAGQLTGSKLVEWHNARTSV